MGAEARPRVEPVGPADRRRWRTLRLEALADTPIGFGELLADARRRDGQGWRAGLARDGVDLLAVRAGADVAMAGGFPGRGDAVPVGPGDEQVATLFAVYVTPAARGTGLLAPMVEAVAAWARGQGRRVLALDVHEDNGPARRAYDRLGFGPDGRDRPYALDPSRRLVGMERAL